MAGQPACKLGFRFPARTAQTDRSRPVSAKIGPRFGPRPKLPPGQKLDFSLEADIRFMGPSWVRANGPIFGKVYIVWVCAPRYRPLSCRKSCIREKRTSKLGSNFAALIFCIYGVYSVYIWQRFQGSLVTGPTFKNWKTLISVVLFDQNLDLQWAMGAQKSKKRISL